MLSKCYGFIIDTARHSTHIESMKEIVKLEYPRVRGSEIREVLHTWPKQSRVLGHTLIALYGLPHEATQTMFIWHFNGPWKRTVLHKTGATHNIPHPHIDILEQTVDAKIPIDKHDDISSFDGSIIIDRTRGEMTAFCENEHSNVMILNLAHDIAIGTKTVQEATDYMKKYEGPVSAMWPNPYRESLQFTSTILANNPDMVTQEPD